MRRSILGRAVLCAVMGVGVVAGVAAVPSEARAQAAQTLELQVVTAPGIRPQDVVIGTGGTLDLRDRTTLEAAVSNVGAGRTEIGSGAVTADVWSEPGAFVRNNALVKGGLVSGGRIELQAGARILGGKTEFASFANPGSKILSVTWPTGTPENVTVEPGRSRTLVPGKSYGTVSVRNNATLLLSGGQTFVSGLEIEPGATVVLDDANQKVELYVKTRMFFRGKIRTLTNQYPDWLLGYFGTERAPIEASYKGLIIAPSAQLTLATVPERQHEGQFFAKALEVAPDTRVVFRRSEFMVDRPLRSTVGSPTGMQCQSDLELVNLQSTGNGLRWEKIERRATSDPACPPVELCSFSGDRETGVGTFTPITLEQVELGQGAATEPCPPFGEDNLNGECPAKPDTLREVDCKGSDALCNTAAGERCQQACDTAACESKHWVCAVPGDCKARTLDSDPLGCSVQEVWNCDRQEKNPTEQEIWEKAHPITDDELMDAPSSIVPTPPQYMALAQTEACQPPTPLQKTGNAGQPYDDPGEDLFAADDSGELNRPIILGGEMFGLYAFPNVYHSYNVTAGNLDEFAVDIQASGSLVAGAQVLKQSITALDVNAKAIVSQCGVEAEGKFLFFGEPIAQFTPVNTKSQACAEAFEAMTRASEIMRQAMIRVRKMKQAYETGATGQAICTLAKDFYLDPNDLDCSGYAGNGAEYVNAAVGVYDQLTGTYTSARQQYQAAADATDTSRPEPALSGNLIENPFTVFSAEAAIPIGPVAITVAGSLTGEWGIDGNVYYGLEHGSSTAEPSFTAGAGITPYINFDSSVFVGVGFNLGVASASIGVEGQLVPLIGIAVPVRVDMNLQRETHPDSEGLRDLQQSDFAGELIQGIPSQQTYKWNAHWKIGAGANLETLSGKLNAAARVRFLFYSKTFRKKITDWQGKEFAIPLAGLSFDTNVPQNAVPSLTPITEPAVDFGWFGDSVGYTKVVPVATDVTTALPVPTSIDICDEIWIQ